MSVLADEVRGWGNDSKKHAFLKLFLSVFARLSACLSIDVKMKPHWLGIFFPTARSLRPYCTLQA
jgi:hypothetical protein